MKHGMMMDKLDDEPIMKKARTEDTLEPEESFLSKFQVKVSLRVCVYQDVFLKIIRVICLV